MVKYIIKNILKSTKSKYRLTLKATTSENTLISLMNKTPKGIELSSLPILNKDIKEVELSLSGLDKEKIKKEFQKYIDFLEKQKIPYKLF
jgi:hypothetical protein